VVYLIDTTASEDEGAGAGNGGTGLAIRGELTSFRSEAEASSLALMYLDGGSDGGAEGEGEGAGSGETQGVTRWLAVLGTYGDLHLGSSPALYLVLLEVDGAAGRAVGLCASSKP
jgi:hypothetical protein